MRALTMPVIVTENGKRKRVSAVSAMYRGTVLDAVKGSTKARSQVFEWGKFLGLIEDASADAQERLK